MSAENKMSGAGCCFHELYHEEFDSINSKKKQLNYLQGENLFKQGAFSPYVMYIIDGLVKVYLQTGYDKQINLRLAKKGDFLAFSSVFGENIYHYSALALKDSTICMIDKTALSRLLIEKPDFAMHITSRNIQNEHHLYEIIKSISYKQMRGKLASTLIYLSSEELTNEEVFKYLSRQDIADFASISTESAIKFLKEFEKEGILQLNNKDIRITDLSRLEEIEKRG
ncbi:MAG: Crp/Fnr family transcriptional regulator [Bacteroidetes bacterium]|nr:Crp/Fnr family transcriptional regulator [Bacteroidota bacterium]